MQNILIIMNFQHETFISDLIHNYNILAFSIKCSRILDAINIYNTSKYTSYSFCTKYLTLIIIIEINLHFYLC